jgi:hypothetical protein
VEVELDPEQSDEIVRAVVQLLAEAEPERPADPWWQAGQKDALRP